MHDGGTPVLGQNVLEGCLGAVTALDENQRLATNRLDAWASRRA